MLAIDCRNSECNLQAHLGCAASVSSSGLLVFVCVDSLHVGVRCMLVVFPIMMEDLLRVMVSAYLIKQEL